MYKNVIIGTNQEMLYRTVVGISSQEKILDEFFF